MVKKVIGRCGSLTAIQDRYGRVWLCQRKKLKRDNRRRTPGKVIHKSICCMSKYSVNNFLSNIDYIAEQLDRQERKEGIAKILVSLQRPLEEVLACVCEKQKKDAEELYNTLGWIWEKKI